MKKYRFPLRVGLTAIAWTAVACTAPMQAQVWSLSGPQPRHSLSAVFDPTTQQMILFGGQVSGASTGLNDVWLAVTASSQDETFTQLLPTGTPPVARYGHVATYDSNSNRMTVFGGATGNPAPCASDVWILTGADGRSGLPAWISESPSGSVPGGRVYAAGVYDPTTNAQIIFGGSDCSTGYFNDVWVLSNANGESGSQAWTQLFPSGTPPSARESATAVYDSVNNILTIYAGDAGGAPLSDVWILSHANGTGGTPTWTKLNPTGPAPLARTGHNALYDSNSDRMMIFGGLNGTQTLSDTWILTSANGIGAPGWIELKTQGTAPSLAYAGAMYSQSTDQMFVFGGTSADNKFNDQSHAFTLTNANGLNKGGKWFLGGPPVRHGQSAFYDSVTNGYFVFAGAHSTNLVFNDYWEASDVIGATNLKWTVLKSSGHVPSARYGQTGLYDSGSNRFMVFGGSTGKCQNDYYVLENANTTGGNLTWLSLSPTGVAPSARVLQSSAYSASNNTIMLFGGFDCSNTYYNDVWLLSNANDVGGTPNWTQVTPAGSSPSAREAASVIYDPTTNALVIYGGDAGKTTFGDIWILSNANGSGGTPTWTQLQPSNNGPVARSGHTAVYDSVNNRMTVYGGFDGTNVLSDVWILSDANGQGTATWTQSVSGQPRRFHSSSYDASVNDMITYGGDSAEDPQVPSSDLYTLTDANGLP